MKFSIPYNPFLSSYELKTFIAFLKEYKQYIFDVYATAYIKPFSSDAMGINNDEINKQLLINAYIIQKETEIPLSLTFNNICVSPSYDNYKIFLNEFKKLDGKFKTITIPFASWLKFGLKSELNLKLVKNTILWNLNDPAKIFKQFESGFDYVNLDRNLIRNTDVLSEIKKMKKIAEKKLGKKLYLSILINESCESNCSIQNDHFVYNLTRKNNDKTFFNSELKNISCEKFDNENPELYLLKSANLICDYEELNYYGQFIDVFKLHGRENKNVFYNSLEIIKNYAKMNKYDYKYKSILKNYYNEFKNNVRNCKFRCYKCNYCEEILQKEKEGIKVKLFKGV